MWQFNHTHLCDSFTAPIYGTAYDLIYSTVLSYSEP